MINIDNSQPTEITIPIRSAESLEFHFVHHLSGQSIFIEVDPTHQPLADYFTGVIFSGKFKYLGLYSVVVKNLLQEILYTTLATVSEPKPAIPSYTKQPKLYELYK